MLPHLSRHPVRYALLLVLVAFAVVTIVKTRQGAWFSFR
jgi:Flp pilus assembly pilin Flp